MAQFSFQGAGGALIVTLIAFTIVFIVLIGLAALISANRYLAKILERKDAVEETAPSGAVRVSASASQTSGAKDMKKVVAAISAVINASVGRRVNILSVTKEHMQGSCVNVTPVWRVKGIAECMENRLGSRSW
jgi:Na+-transporting methylmalonyl-CoA/oxaloacetate decarboxylase gamma subunit